MRKLFLFVLLWFSTFGVYAQVACDSTYKDFTHNAFKHLDKSQITSGILYEYVMPFAGLDEFNSNTDSSSYLHFMQAYYELYESSLNSLLLPHPLDYAEAIDNFHTDAEYHHPVGVLDFKFNTIDSNAVDNNQLTISGGSFYDVQGRSSSPYLDHVVFLATPLLSDDYDNYSGGTHYLHFKDEFVLSNTGFNLSMVQHLEIRLNGNVVHSAYVAGLHNQVVSVAIPNTDQEHTIAIKFTLTSNFIDRIYLQAINRVLGEEKMMIEACNGYYNMVVEGYDFGLPYGTPAAANQKGIASVYFADANCASQQITKPIIFIDGFDPGNSTHHRKIWDDYLNFEYTDYDGIDKFLGDSLRAAGYDIIILDQVKTGKFNTGGGAFIERNGLVLAKLLTTLYNTYSSTLQDDFVVVGASMGGLVARYGLAWMENQGIPHHTRLFVSFDSPQNGAYIPLGMQYMVDGFTQNGLLSWSTKVNNMLHNSAAAKQMLLLHSSTRKVHTDEVTAHPYRQIFLDNLAAVGNWPTQCRIVAINNGNRIGRKKNQSPPPEGAETIGVSEKIMDLGIKQRLMGGSWCSSDACYKLRLKVWTQPENGKEVVHSFMHLGFNPLLKLITFSSPFTLRIKYNPALNGESLDIAPGSRIATDYLSAVDGKFIGMKIRNIIGVVSGKFNADINKSMHTNFIPTVSSVAYTFPNDEPVSYYKNFTGITLSKCAGTTPFDTVYAPTYDMNHVGIDAFIAEAFKDEVYNPKLPSSCGSPGIPCPEHNISNAKITQNIAYHASRSIVLQPGFEVPAGKAFKTQIGCSQGLTTKPPGENNTSQMPMATCEFEWDIGKMDSWCDGSNTIYHIFVRNVPYHTYPEFSANGSNWYQPSIGGSGMEFLLPGQNGWTVYARLKDDPSSVIQYTFSACSSGVNIEFNNEIKTKYCDGNQITQTVYIDNLPSGATVQFSMDGGNNWSNANVGSNGYAYTHTPTNNYINYMARTSTDPGYTVSSQFHSSCSNISGMDWGTYTVSKGQPGDCIYEVSVTGLAIDSHAEFSVDNGSNWYKAGIGNYGHVFILQRGHGTHQDFWFRPMEYPNHPGVWGHLSVCDL